LSEKTIVRFLVDENLPVSLVKFLRSMGFEAHRVSDVGLRGARDEEIANFAFRNGYVVMTLDKDFGYIYHRLYRGRLTVVLLRPRLPTPQKIVALVKAMLERVDIANYTGRLIVVGEKRVRVI